MNKINIDSFLKKRILEFPEDLSTGMADEATKKENYGNYDTHEGDFQNGYKQALKDLL